VHSRCHMRRGESPRSPREGRKRRPSLRRAPVRSHLEDGKTTNGIVLPVAVAEKTFGTGIFHFRVTPGLEPHWQADGLSGRTREPIPSRRIDSAGSADSVEGAKKNLLRRTVRVAGALPARLR